MKVRRIDHLVLSARDPAVLIAFYCDVLGLTVERTVARANLVQLRAGECLIDIVSGRSTSSAENLQHFCLTLDDYDESQLRGQLAAHGVEAGPTVEVYGAEGFGPSIYIRDPEGNQVELKGPAVRGL